MGESREEGRKANNWSVTCVVCINLRVQIKRTCIFILCCEIALIIVMKRRFLFMTRVLACDYERIGFPLPFISLYLSMTCLRLLMICQRYTQQVVRK